MPERFIPIRHTKRELPEITKGGVLVDPQNIQPEVRKNAESANDWEYKEEAKFLYRMAVTFRDRLVDPILRTDRSQVPDPVISFDDMRK